MLLGSDQNIQAPWFVPVAIALVAFGVTWVRVPAALPLLILAAAMDRYRLDMAGAGLRIEHFVFSGVVLAWILKTRPHRAQFYFTHADLLLAAYLALAAFSSVLWAPQPRESFKFLGLMLFGVLLYGVTRALAATAAAFERGMTFLIVTAVSAALFGIVAWLAWPAGINLGVQVYALPNFTTYSPYGTLFDSNTLGIYAMAGALLQITLVLDPQFARWRLALSAGILITLAAVALSLTRAAWVGLAVGLILILLASPRRRLAFAIGIGAAGLVVLALVVNSALAGGGNALAEFSAARLLTRTSIVLRLDSYARAWNDFLAHPVLGNGANVFAQKYIQAAGARDWISNLVLMTLHDTGIVGLLLLGTWLGWLALVTWRALSRAVGRARTLLVALGIAYVALLVTYQATTIFWLGLNWIYLGLLRAGSLSTEASLPAGANPK